MTTNTNHTTEMYHGGTDTVVYTGMYKRFKYVIKSSNFPRLYISTKRTLMTLAGKSTVEIQDASGLKHEMYRYLNPSGLVWLVRNYNKTGDFIISDAGTMEQDGKKYTLGELKYQTEEIIDAIIKQEYEYQKEFFVNSD